MANVTTNDGMLQEVFKTGPAGIALVPGKVVPGRIIAKDKGKILVDLGGVATGIVAGKELVDAFNTAKTAEIGDEVMTFVLQDENDEGMVVLSFRKASQMRAWDKFLEMKGTKQTLDVIAKEANKGGLMVDAMGVKAFLPVSQLAPVHYPRVDGANAQAILAHLESFLGQKFTVCVITIDEETRKLVVSEREAMGIAREKEMTNLKVGQSVKGRIHGLVKFGAFMTFGNLEGLIHISEISWGHIKTPGEGVRIGQEVDAMVIGIDGEKISLSMKRLMPDPWIDKVKAFEIGSRVKGFVNKTSDIGVFVTLADDINGLVHTSQMNEGDIPSHYKEGQEVEVMILEINEGDHSLKLSFKANKEEADAAAERKNTKRKKKEEMVTEVKEEVVE